MATPYNPALRQEPRDHPIQIFALLAEESILGWLESNGRFRSLESEEFQHDILSKDLDDILDPAIYSQEEEEEDPED